MRPTKNRSRFKQNRNRTNGNTINRVFESSGPEGKVRGTPQQIIDKYNQLARDAFLSHDHVASENFHQHAEYYTRLLSEARREQQDAQSRERSARTTQPEQTQPQPEQTHPQPEQTHLPPEDSEQPKLITVPSKRPATRID